MKIDMVVEAIRERFGAPYYSDADRRMATQVAEIAVSVYQAMHNDNICPELKVLRDDRAKEFPLITYKKDGDVGLDLPSIILDDDGKPTSVTVMPGEEVTMSTGIRLELPYGYWAHIKPRSSSTKRRLIADGTIDTGYRGELFATVVNTGHVPQVFEHGDRIVQCVIHKAVYAEIVEVDKLSESERGESGFGSTGTKT